MMYLVQSGKFTGNFNENSYKLFKEAIDLDYMGYAEFEFGAIPNAFMYFIEAYKYNLENNQGCYKVVDTGLKNINDVPLYIICANKAFKTDNDMNEYCKSYIKDINKYIEGNNPNEICTYHTKGHIKLARRFYEFYRKSNREDYKRRVEYAKKHHIDVYYPKISDFWWDIRNNTFMFFGKDRIDIIKKILDSNLQDEFIIDQLNKRN